MLRRYLEHPIQELSFDDHKIAFISGPRQVGKTTLARQFLDQPGSGRYYTWDDVAFRRLCACNPADAIPTVTEAAPALAAMA